MMGVSGRNRLMSRGVAPLLVTVMMAEALVSVAVVQAAWAVAPPMPRRMSGGHVPHPAKVVDVRLSPAGNGRHGLHRLHRYLPAAVSPESMMAEVPS